MEIRPTKFTEISVSFRHDAGHIHCAYVTETTVRSDGQQSIIRSRHISGLDEGVIDQALACVRTYTLDDVLTHVEPF